MLAMIVCSSLLIEFVSTVYVSKGHVAGVSCESVFEAVLSVSSR